MSRLFSADMSYLKALMGYLMEIDGKTDDEKEAIFEEFKEVSHIISKREMKLAAEGWMC